MKNVFSVSGVRPDKYRARLLAPAALLSLSLVATPSRADEATLARRRAAAEALFDDAKRLMEEQRYAEACPKLEESQELDAGVGTLLNLADCLEHLGRTASAWSEFRRAASAARAKGQSDREAIARERAEKLEPKLARLVITPHSSDAIASLDVRRDGETIGRALWGTPIPVDPGEHVVEARAPGKRLFRAIVEVPKDEGARLVTSIPKLEDAPDAFPGRAQRIFSLAAGGAAVVSIGVGSILGAQALSKNKDSGAHCIAGNFCDQAGVALRSEAITAGNAATVSFILGAAFTAGGLALWFTAPQASPVRPGVGSVGTGTGLILGGVF